MENKDEIKNSLSKADALRAYACMMNTFSPEILGPLLADDFHYSSQWVIEEFHTREQYMDYIVPKLENIKRAGLRCWVEMAEFKSHLTVPDIMYDEEQGRMVRRRASIKSPWSGPCLVIAHRKPDFPTATVQAEVEGGKIKSIALCGMPSPEMAIRSGDYPLNFEGAAIKKRSGQ